MPAKRETLGEFTAGELADVESPELTDKELASLAPARKALAPRLHAALTGRKPGRRDAQKAASKEMITIRVDREVVATYRASGPGWQARMNDALAVAAQEIKNAGEVTR